VDGQKVTCADVAERLRISHPAAHKRLNSALDRGENLTWAGLGEGAPPSRAQQILRFLADLGRAAKLDEIVEGIAGAEPKMSRHLSTMVAAQLGQLHNAGKLERFGTRCNFAYRPTAEALIDRRKTRTPAATATASQSMSVAKPKPPEVAKAKAPRRKDAAPTPQAKRPGEFRIIDRPAPLVIPNANLTRPREAALDSSRIAADVAAFQARGGRVERLANGQTSQPTKCFLAAQAANRRRQHADNDDSLDADDLTDVA
jgi:hypothetical protein